MAWADCAGGSPAGTAADLGAQLGLQLYGPVEEDRRLLTRSCAEHRFSVILHEVDDAGQRAPYGWSSGLLTTRHPDLRAPEGAAEAFLETAVPAPDPGDPGEAERRLPGAMAAWAPGCRLELPAASLGLEAQAAERAY